MRRISLTLLPAVVALAIPGSAFAQTPARPPAQSPASLAPAAGPDGVMLVFERFADVYGSRFGLIPPSALPPKPRTAIALSRAALAKYVGLYRLAPGFELQVTLKGDSLFAQASTGNGPVQLWPESPSDFFVKEADAQVTFKWGARGAVTGLVLHQYGRDRPGTKVRWRSTTRAPLSNIPMNPTSAADGLKRRHGDPEARGLKQAQAKVGELAMRLELAEMLLEKKGVAELPPKSIIEVVP